MEPASTIISKLGGPSAVAKIAGVHRTRVSNWMRAKDVGGTGGVIPFKHVPVLLSTAAALGVGLTVADFLPRTVADLPKANSGGSSASAAIGPVKAPLPALPAGASR